MRHTFPSENESELVGLEQNVRTLVGYLVEEENIQVISICGMGGIGKTTLARQVFNHEMVKNTFDGMAWVCISQQFTQKYVWVTILQKLSSEYDEHRVANMTEDELQDKLFRLLQTSKSLIVLDDMWKEKDWDKIKHVFPPTTGWKVLLTSRNEGVGLHANPKCVTFKPECLTPEQSWTLLGRIAFPRKDTSDLKVDIEMEEMGKTMIKHCRGLPLAVKVLGGLLATQHTMREWERINEDIRSRFIRRTTSSDGNSNSVHHVLSLSFEELPSYLKYCFLYLAQFPEDYEIDVDKLSYYWAAEVIPRPSYYNGLAIREVADRYIEELVKRNMVISKRNVRTSRFETCQLHDTMREVCLLKAEEENFLQVVDDTSTIVNSKTRRVAIRWPYVKDHSKGEIKNPKIRSLLFFNPFYWTGSRLRFTQLQLVRILDLSGAEFRGGKLPSSIGKLIHLRYLSLYGAYVRHLPSSMRNLKLLLYLNLDVTVTFHEVYVPNFLKEMRELIYLCLPRKIHEKTKFELGNLVNLETLENFSTTSGRVMDLQSVTRLGTLSIEVGKGCTMEAISSSLSELRHLENLTIDLHYCSLVEDPMAILEKLLHLNEVKISTPIFYARRMVCSADGFPHLQKLSFFRLAEWEEWEVEEGSMPLLHTLTINGCRKLKELPNGLIFLTSITNLHIYCMEEEWVKRLSEGGKDYYKVQHIPYVTFI